MQHKKLQYKISGIISDRIEEINEKDIHFFHSYMGSKKDSNLYLLMKVHNPTLKTQAIIDTNHTLLVPVSIWLKHQLQQLNHLLLTPI